MYIRSSTAGFSLVEIVMVVVILGILASIAIPRVIGPNEEITSSEGRETLAALLASQLRYFYENNVYVADAGLAAGTLDIDIPVSKYFNAPNATLPVAGNTFSVANVQRTGGLYTLRISTTGTIYCTDGTITCLSIHCNKGAGANQCNN